MNDKNLQHPAISMIEIYGYPHNPESFPTCPVCGAETDAFYRIRRYGNIVGCEECVYKSDAWEGFDGEF